jgi:hypothetical protein
LPGETVVLPSYDLPLAKVLVGEDLVQEHIAVAHTNSYLWLNPGDEISVGHTLGYRSYGASGNTFQERTGLSFYRWQDPEVNDAPSFMVRIAQACGTEASGTTTTKAAPVATYTVDKPGYFRIALSPTSFTPDARVAAEDSNPRIVSFQIVLRIERATNAIRWYTTPEFHAQHQLYRCARTTSCAYLCSNRTPLLSRGGSVMAAAAKDEAAMFDLYRMPGALNAKASTRPLGYTGDASTGLYSWSKLGRDDCNMVEWVNDHGSPIYHLTLESTCSLAIITTPPGTTATFMVSQDHHLEAEVDLSQSWAESDAETAHR